MEGSGKGLELEVVSKTMYSNKEASDFRNIFIRAGVRNACFGWQTY